VTDERSRGVVLYGLTALMLAGGVFWFLRAAPSTEVDPRVAAWRETAESVLPDLPLQADADTIVLRGEQAAERSTAIDGGSYALSMLCAGTGQVRVRVSTGDNDSGRAVRCSDEPTPETIRVALADEFYLQVSAEEDGGGAVFRWRLQRTRRY
jgi:hypothetical protein